MIGGSFDGRANCDVNWAEYKSLKTYVEDNHKIIEKSRTDTFSCGKFVAENRRRQCTAGKLFTFTYIVSERFAKWTKIFNNKHESSFTFNWLIDWRVSPKRSGLIIHVSDREVVDISAFSCHNPFRGCKACQRMLLSIFSVRLFRSSIFWKKS